MRIAVRSESAIGIRTARVLGADPDITLVGLVATSYQIARDLPRIPVGQLGQFDVLVTDGELRSDDLLCGTAVSAWDEQPDWEADAATVVVGGNPRGLAVSLAHLELKRLTAPSLVVVAWTGPGDAPTNGQDVWFPEPLGRVRGAPVDLPTPVLANLAPGNMAHGVAAPTTDRWAGVLVRTVGYRNGSHVQRTVGVADDRMFVEAIALGAAAAAAARGEYSAGLSGVYGAPEAYVEAAVRSGLAVASYSSEVSSGSSPSA